MTTLPAACCSWVSRSAFSLGSAHAASRLVARGKYLTDIIPCTDCHTPGTFLGHPDMSRYLGGSDVGFAVPGLGVFYGSNLTPDNDTGLGKWTVKQIATAITDGRSAGRPQARAANAGGMVPPPDQIRRAGDRLLSEDAQADEQQGSRPVRTDAEAGRLRHAGRAGGQVRSTASAARQVNQDAPLRAKPSNPSKPCWIASSPFGLIAMTIR